jgi:hypothetical protein
MGHLKQGLMSVSDSCWPPTLCLVRILEDEIIKNLDTLTAGRFSAIVTESFTVQLTAV